MRWAGAAGDVDAAVEAAMPRVERLADELIDAEHIFVVGSGNASVAALEAALKLKEMAIVHAEGAESWEMATGGATIVGPGTVVIALAPNGPGREATLDVARHAAGWGARIVEVGPGMDQGGGPTARRGGAPAHTRDVGRGLLATCRSRPGGLARLRPRQATRPQPRSTGLGRALPQPGPPPHRGRRKPRGGGLTMPRIVLVGAGSVEFTRNLLGDFFSFPELRDAEIVLHDIDPDRLATAVRMAHWTAAALGATPTVTASLNRREALAGADFVIDIVQVGGSRATQIDFDVPARYGLHYTINDTINVGGVFRGLRSIPVVLGIARDMADVCPDAALLNYANPLAILVKAVHEGVGLPVVGLCHSVYWTVHSLAGYLGLPFEEVDALSGGVNHLAWILRLEHRGKDLYPALRSVVESGRRPGGRPGARRAVPPLRLLPDRILRAPRGVQPLVHIQGQGGKPPHPDRRVPLASGPQPGRVRGDEASARRG